MAPPSAVDLQAQIVREVSDPNSTVAPIIAVLWNAHQLQGDIDPRLQYLYAKRSALDVRLAEEQPTTDFTVGKQVTDAQAKRFDHLQTMRMTCQEEIVRVEGLARSQRKPAFGSITKVEIVPAPAQSVDPLDVIGSPFVRVDPRP